MTETCSAVLRSRWNCSSDGAERTDDGRAFHARAAVTGKARSPSVQIKRAGGNNNNSVKLGYILLFIVVRYFLLLILTRFNGTEMAFYVLMCRKETAHSLTVKSGQLVRNGDLRGGGGLDVRGRQMSGDHAVRTSGRSYTCGVGLGGAATERATRADRR